LAYRDREMLPHEFLTYILAMKRRHLKGLRPGPTITVVSGCTGYLVTQREYPPQRMADTAAMLAAWNGHRHSPAQ